MINRLLWACCGVKADVAGITLGYQPASPPTHPSLCWPIITPLQRVLSLARRALCVMPMPSWLAREPSTLGCCRAIHACRCRQSCKSACGCVRLEAWLRLGAGGGGGMCVVEGRLAAGVACLQSRLAGSPPQAAAHGGGEGGGAAAAFPSDEKIAEHLYDIMCASDLNVSSLALP